MIFAELLELAELAGAEGIVKAQCLARIGENEAAVEMVKRLLEKPHGRFKSSTRQRRSTP